MEQNQQTQPPVFNPQQPAQQPAPQYQPRVAASPMMDPIEAVKTCLKKYFDFKGRARRSEYWWFILFVFIVSAVFNFLGGFHPVFSYIALACSLLLTIPMLSALTRRLHDTSRSGWWVLVYGLAILAVYGAMIAIFYPIADQLTAEGDEMMLAGLFVDAIQDSPVAATTMFGGSLLTTVIFIITLIFSIMDSHWGENKYGPSPKYK